MPSWALKLLLPLLIEVVENVMSSVDFRQYADMMFDFLKQAIRDSETNIDDKLALPIVEALEKAFGDPSD